MASGALTLYVNSRKKRGCFKEQNEHLSQFPRSPIQLYTLTSHWLILLQWKVENLVLAEHMGTG